MNTSYAAGNCGKAYKILKQDKNLGWLIHIQTAKQRKGRNKEVLLCSVFRAAFTYKNQPLACKQEKMPRHFYFCCGRKCSKEIVDNTITMLLAETELYRKGSQVHYLQVHTVR